MQMAIKASIKDLEQTESFRKAMSKIKDDYNGESSSDSDSDSSIGDSNFSEMEISMDSISNKSK